ncbi:MAG: helix-turn-helix domain-containing protein [Pseudomonadales bacterium]|nr:helix-turn-helix domain-containing protein [Pseudomonadales bacterium]
MNENTALDNVLVALADPTRREVMELLGYAPHRASELAEATGTSRSRMSKHLRLLLEVGAVRDERSSDDARARVFYLQPKAIEEMQTWLDRLQSQWDEQLQSFKRHIEERDKEDKRAREREKRGG